MSKKKKNDTYSYKELTEYIDYISDTIRNSLKDEMDPKGTLLYLAGWLSGAGFGND